MRISATIRIVEQVHFESLYPDTARFADIEKLAGFIKDGKSSQLIGIPGVGRTTVLGLLAHNRKLRIKHFGEDKTVHFILVNFSEIRKRPLIDATKFLFLSVSNSFRERGMQKEYEKVNVLFKEALKFRDELVLFQVMKEAFDYLILERKLKTIFLFDRFEEYVPTVTSEFFTNLRTLRSRYKYQFCVVFSVNRPLDDLLEPSILSDFYEFVAGNQVYLSLRDDVTTDFRVGYIEKITGKKITQKTFEMITEQAGGVGKIIKISVEVMLGDSVFRHPGNSERSVEGSRISKGLTVSDERDSGQARMTEKELGDALYSQKLVQNAVADICRSFTPAEQSALIKSNFADLAIVEYLQNVGVLNDFIIQIPLFARHIAMHVEERKNSYDKITFEENTGTIKSGDMILSDQLTSSEFKLLSFLLQNPDRIVDRDEIIGSVWSDVKSTAGITDQAVDQLIFRLRKKIEEDHNNPVHLVTVKGRGFRFIA